MLSFADTMPWEIAVHKILFVIVFTILFSLSVCANQNRLEIVLFIFAPNIIRHILIVKDTKDKIYPNLRTFQSIIGDYVERTNPRSANKIAVIQ